MKRQQPPPAIKERRAGGLRSCCCCCKPREEPSPHHHSRLIHEEEDPATTKRAARQSRRRRILEASSLMLLYSTILTSSSATSSSCGSMAGNLGRQPAFMRRVATASRRQHHVVVAAPWLQQLQQQQLVAPWRSWSMTPRHHHHHRHHEMKQRQRQQGVLGRWSSRYTFMHSMSLGSSASAQLSFFSDDDDGDDDEDSEKNLMNALETASTLLPSSPSSLFQVTSDYEPAGDQPAAIRQLVHQMTSCATATTATADRFSILRGCTGTGKTLVMSHVLAAMNKPTLVLCHNKTLAVQLARELRSFLQNNAVELFVSYYNRYRPEFYQETTGTYMAKKSVVNAELDALRHCATRALLSRRDVVVVSSVSCLFGLGLPKEYLDASTELRVHETVVEWNCFLERLIGRMLYTCNQDDDVEFDRGQFQVMDLQQDDDDSDNQTSTSDPQSQRRRVKLVTLWPPHNNYPMQIELRQVSSDDTATCTDQEFFMVHAIREGSAKGFLSIPKTRLFPARHHVVAEDRLEEACLSIEEELHHRVKELEAEGKKTEALRLQARVVNDVYLLRETGFCKGIENYSRHFAGRQAGEPPDTLLDYFKLLGDWFLIVDESHVTLPQLRSMYAGDRARKQQLVKHGFRLPSALDNRPLRDDEFWERVGQTLFVSATPSKQELDLAERDPVDMVIRPTFVCDPVIEVRPKNGQLEDLLREVKARADKNERTLAIALTKRDSEDLSSFLLENGVKSAYLHSGLSTVERSDALRSLQSGDIDCLVGVNCLREGLDLPQVSLVAVLNTDSEGFLRSDTALLQIVGRAARNINGRAIFYANRTTESMRRCIDSTSEHRERQLEYNEKHGHQMRSTKGSSTMTFFDLLKDRIDAEQGFDTLIKKSFHEKQNFPLISTSAKVHVPNDASLTLAPTVETDHIPSSPGVYFWKDGDGSILYIGKAVKLRSRVRSYLAPNAKHGARIQNMLQLAATVDIMLTPSERDALVLESKLIKHHQPRFNVLLKDDEHYPYICASVGDAIPRLSVVPKRPENQPTASSPPRFRYFGPYTSFKEINRVLDEIESKYDLRAQNFQVRHGSLEKEEYNKLFQRVLGEVFCGHGACGKNEKLTNMRREYEEAGLLFDSEDNVCRDVVTVLPVDNSKTKAVVSVLQLRDGLVAGHFSYSCEVPFGLDGDQDCAAAVHTILTERHYPSGEESPNGAFSWFPDRILLSLPSMDARSLRNIVRQCRSKVEPHRAGTVSVATAATKGPRKLIDTRVLDFAVKNVKQKTPAQSIDSSAGLMGSVWDGTAASELAQLLSLDSPPSRIECYDISHTQGDFPVGSRVVFIDGRPAPHLYRKFNIKSVDGVNDYASIEEVLERRFNRAWVNGKGGLLHSSENPWSMPDLVVIDGGRGQLSAAIKALSRANIVPMGLATAEAAGTERLISVAVCALAKDQELIYIDDQQDPVNDRPDSPAVLLLRALRDESHRFALSAHRQQRSVLKSIAAGNTMQQAVVFPD